MKLEKHEESEFDCWYFLWLHLRRYNSFNQIVPNFKGCKLQIRMIVTGSVIKAVEKYLPPSNAKVTDYCTIQKYMSYLQQLAEQANLLFFNITLDVGAAINTYLVIWNVLEKFSKIAIHPGSFHFLKENFQVVNIMFASC